MIEFLFSARLRPFRLTLVLGAAAFFLLILLLIEWFLIKPERLPPPTPGKGAEQQSQDNLLGEAFSLPAVGAFKETVERPVFMESRRPAPPAPPGAAVKSEPPPPISLKLMGILSTPEGQMVLIADAKGKYRRLKPKETVEGWEIVEIMGDRVRLHQAGIDEDLPLVKKHPKGSNPAAQTPGAPANANQGQPGQPGSPAAGQQAINAAGQNVPPHNLRQNPPPRRSSEDEGMMPSDESPSNEAPQAPDMGGSDESSE